MEKYGESRHNHKTVAFFFMRHGMASPVRYRALINSFTHFSINRAFVHSVPFEVLLVVIFGILAPTALTVGIPTIDEQIKASTSNSIMGAVACALAMSLLLRRFRLYPGTAVARFILPALSSFYAIFISVVALFRIDYSSQILLSSFLATLAARYAIETLHVRVKRMLYFVVPGGRVSMVEELKYLPTVALSSPSIAGLPYGAIIADLDFKHADEWERLLAEAAIAGRPVYHYKQIWEAQTGKVQINHLSENSFGALVPSFIYQKFKRGVDAVICMLALPLVVPIMLVCAFLIKRDSAGPVFFRQRRMGFRGKVFHVIKFRTMTDCHNGDSHQLSVNQSGDQRITRIGTFLRRTRLDELPQIINIMRGEMSWIGPRPEAAGLSHLYEAEIPFYRYRHIVRPGISGWAQVNQGHVSSVADVDHKLQFDFYYIKNLSYWLDILIAVRTVWVVLTGFGAK